MKGGMAAAAPAHRHSRQRRRLEEKPTKEEVVAKVPAADGQITRTDTKSTSAAKQNLHQRYGKWQQMLQDKPKLSYYLHV